MVRSSYSAKLAVLLVLALLLLLPTFSVGGTTTIQPSDDDAYLYINSPDTTWGASTDIVVGSEKVTGQSKANRGIVLFDLSSIPAGVTITSVGRDGAEPYSTSDSTPDVLVTTDENADCFASIDGDETYDLMSDDVDCTGDGTASHTCDFTTVISDSASQAFYVACQTARHHCIQAVLGNSRVRTQTTAPETPLPDPAETPIPNNEGEGPRP